MTILLTLRAGDLTILTDDPTVTVVLHDQDAETCDELVVEHRSPDEVASRVRLALAGCLLCGGSKRIADDLPCEACR